MFIPFFCHDGILSSSLFLPHEWEKWMRSRTSILACGVWCFETASKLFVNTTKMTIPWSLELGMWWVFPHYLETENTACIIFPSTILFSSIKFILQAHINGWIGIIIQIHRKLDSSCSYFSTFIVVIDHAGDVNFFSRVKSWKDACNLEKFEVEHHLSFPSFETCILRLKTLVIIASTTFFNWILRWIVVDACWHYIRNIIYMISKHTTTP